MSFAGVSYMAALIAAVAGFAFGAVWYMALGSRWAAAVGKPIEVLNPGGRPPVPQMILTFICQLVMATMLAGVIGHLGKGQVTLWNGIVSGLFLWIGFVATTLLVNHGFQGVKRALTVIDGGHWLGVLLIQGAVIGWMGVR